MNRLIYPYSAYPLAGDIKSNAGSNQIIVTGLEQIPLDPNTVGSPAYPAIINYSPLIGKYVATDVTTGGGGGSIVITTTTFTSSAGNFTVAHGLGYSPSYAWVSMEDLGIVAFQVIGWDSTNFYLEGSEASLAGTVIAIK